MIRFLLFAFLSGMFLANSYLSHTQPFLWYLKFLLLGALLVVVYFYAQRRKLHALSFPELFLWFAFFSSALYSTLSNYPLMRSMTAGFSPNTGLLMLFGFALVVATAYYLTRMLTIRSFQDRFSSIIILVR